MINFKITNVGDGFLTVGKADGQSVLLKPGETVRAEVLEILPDGGVILKVKGNLLTARTEVPFEKGATAFFRVADTQQPGKELKLQFAGYAEISPQDAPARSFMNTPKGQALTSLIHELSSAIAKDIEKALTGGTGRQGAENISGRPLSSNLSPDTLERLIKALPADMTVLPKEVKLQLQELLTASLKTTGQGIQMRLDTLLHQLPEAIKNSPLITVLKNELLVNMEKLLPAPLKTALLNTGVAFEAKLKTVVATLQHRQTEEGFDPAVVPSPDTTFEKELTSALIKEIVKQAKESAGELRPALPSDSTEKAPAPKGALSSEFSPLKNDLKAALLELKYALNDKELIEALSSKETAPAKDAKQETHLLKTAQVTIEGLLKDIETFQALSRTTDSFYTFLPLNWKELRDGEIAFKGGKRDTGDTATFSCRINLDLEQYGTLSVLVLMQNREFFVSFKADQPQLQETLSAHLDSLKTSFREKGLTLKAANMLDRNDTSLEHLEKLESFERIVSIKA